MRETIIKSFEDLHEAIQANALGVRYRGLCDISYALVPKVGRSSRYSLERELAAFRMFIIMGRTYLNPPPRSEWEWLAIAQHHGLATRLLDWTRNPLVALYFAVHSTPGADGVIYVRKPRKSVPEDHPVSPFGIGEVMTFIPSYLVPRVDRQQGDFTVHPNPTEALDEEDMQRLIIPKSLKKIFQTVLDKYGIHAGTIFPDLDGQAMFINRVRFDL